MITRERDIPLGAVGPHTREHHADLVRAKFLATGGDPDVAGRLADLELLPAETLAELVELALAQI